MSVHQVLTFDLRIIFACLICCAAVKVGEIYLRKKKKREWRKTIDDYFYFNCIFCCLVATFYRSVLQREPSFIICRKWFQQITTKSMITNRARLQCSQLPESCCTIPDFFDDSQLIACKNANGPENLFRPMNSRKKRFATSRMELGTCYLDCVFQLSGVTSANGQLLDTNKLLKKLLSETPTEQESINVITNAVTQCISDLNAGTMRVRTPILNNCSTTPSAIMMCIHKKFFLNCPSNRFSKTQQCFVLRDYLNRCPVNIWKNTWNIFC